MRQGALIVSISLLGGEGWSKVTRLHGRNAHGSFLSSTANKRISVVPRFSTE